MPEGLLGEGEHNSEGISHKVVEGDTLWKLAETYLGDSGQWPSVWAANVHIENPHWIFPGEVVFLKAPPVGALGALPVREASQETKLAALIERPADLPSTVAVYTLVTPGPLEGWGVIESSMVQAGMLSPLDDISIRLTKDSAARPGETFLILRSQGKLRHPKTKKVLGHLTWVVGAAQLNWREGRQAMGHIVKASGEVLRGDMLGPPGEFNMRPVYLVKSDKKMKGWVVGTEPLHASMAGGQHMVLVDKGTADGAVPGNLFHIVRMQDGLSFESVLKPAVVHEGLPRHVVGACTLVDVRANVSSCLLRWSSREIVVGDSIEME